MKIETILYDENDNVLAKIETPDGSLEAHEEKLYKIQRAIDQEIENQVDDELLAKF